MTQIIALKLYLDGLDPKLWYLCIALLTGLLIEAWRRVSPTSFDKLPSRVKALPAMLIGAVLSTTAASDLKSVFVNAFVGILAGLTAVGGYEARVRLLSGQGSRTEPDSQPIEADKPPTGAQADPTNNDQQQQDQGDGS